MATLSISEKTVSSAAVSKAMLVNLSDLVCAISAADPLKVGLELVSASLLSRETLSKILTVPATPLEKSTTLVMSVLDQVKIVPGKLESFMEILHKSIDGSSFQSEFLEIAPRVPSYPCGCHYYATGFLVTYMY